MRRQGHPGYDDDSQYPDDPPPKPGECVGCGCSRWACDAYRTAGQVCCPDCDHGKAARREEPPHVP